MRELTFFILLLFISHSIYSQSHEIENKRMECFHQSFSDGGIEFKQLIIDYENLLINEGFLENNNPESFIEFLNDFANQNKTTKKPSKIFSIEEDRIKKPDQNKLFKCRKTILSDSTNYESFKLKGIENAIRNNAKPNNTVKDMLKVLSIEDFEVDYYKRQAFLVFLLIDTESGLKKTELDLETLDTKNALNMYLDSKNALYVNGVETTKAQLKEIVKNHIVKNRLKYMIFLKTEKETKYKAYVAYQNIVLNEIQSLRYEYALKTYNTEYKKLSENQKKEVNNTYPENLF